MNFKIKIVLGFRPDQKHSIDAEEAHKAYYAFMNPDKRVVFKDGLAVRGEDIRGIEPDYQGTMGWNTTHQLDDDDMNEIHKKGIDRKLREVISNALGVAQLANSNPEILQLPLQEATQKLLT